MKASSAVLRELSARQRIAKRLFSTRNSATCERRLPSSKRAVSILRLWCTLAFVHVDPRPALKMGSRRARWPRRRRRQKRRRRRRRPPRRSSPREATFLRHIKVRAVCLRELMLPRFDVFQRRSINKPDHEARIRRRVRLFRCSSRTAIGDKPIGRGPPLFSFAHDLFGKPLYTPLSKCGAGFFADHALMRSVHYHHDMRQQHGRRR